MLCYTVTLSGALILTTVNQEVHWLNRRMGMSEFHQFAQPLLGCGCHCGPRLPSPSALSSLPPVPSSWPASAAAPDSTKVESEVLPKLKVKI